MSLDPWGLIGGGFGAIGGLVSNVNRIADINSQIEDLRFQQDVYRRRKGNTAKILRGQLSIDALYATNESKKSAIESFQGISKAESDIAQSGVSGGTPVFHLNKMIADSANNLADQWNEINQKISLEEMQGRAQIDSIDDAISQTERQIDTISKSLDYYNSPAGYIMSALTGALGGAKLGLGLEAMKVSMFGVPQSAPAVSSEPQTDFSGYSGGAGGATPPPPPRTDFGKIWDSNNSALQFGAGDGSDLGKFSDTTPKEFGVNKYGYDTMRQGNSVTVYSKKTTPFLGLSAQNDPLFSGLDFIGINPIDVKKKSWSGFKTFNLMME